MCTLFNCIAERPQPPQQLLHLCEEYPKLHNVKGISGFGGGVAPHLDTQKPYSHSNTNLVKTATDSTKNVISVAKVI